MNSQDFCLFVTNVNSLNRTLLFTIVILGNFQGGGI